MAAVVLVGGENFSSENSFVGFEETSFVWAGSLQRTSSMSEDDSPSSPLSDITHLSCFNIMGSAAAMEPSFGSAITLDSLSWNDGRRGEQRYCTRERLPSRIARNSNLLLRGFR